MDRVPLLLMVLLSTHKQTAQAIALKQNRMRRMQY